MYDLAFCVGKREAATPVGTNWLGAIVKPLWVIRDGDIDAR